MGLAQRDDRSTDAPGLAEATEVPPFHSVGFALSSFGYAVGRRFRTRLEPLELRPREFALMRAVAAVEGRSQQALGEELQIPPSRMVAFVDALEARSLLERRHNVNDRRTRELYLTADGRKLLAQAFELAMGLEQELCADLEPGEREQMIALLARIGTRLNLPAAAHAGMLDDAPSVCAGD